MKRKRLRNTDLLCITTTEHWS